MIIKNSKNYTRQRFKKKEAMNKLEKKNYCDCVKDWRVLMHNKGKRIKKEFAEKHKSKSLKSVCYENGLLKCEDDNDVDSDVGIVINTFHISAFFYDNDHTSYTLWLDDFKLKIRVVHATTCPSLLRDIDTALDFVKFLIKQIQTNMKHACTLYSQTDDLHSKMDTFNSKTDFKIDNLQSKLNDVFDFLIAQRNFQKTSVEMDLVQKTVKRQRLITDPLQPLDVDEKDNDRK